MTLPIFDTHGRIKCATITSPLFVRSLNDYRRVLGLDIVEEGIVDAALADAWAAPDSAGRRYALLQPKSGAACFIRLVEATTVQDYLPLRSFGWAALDIAVQNLAALQENIEADGAFTVMGSPQPAPWLGNGLCLYVRGQANEVIALHQIDRSPAEFDMARAAATVDQIFMAELAAPELEAAVDHYGQAYGFDIGATQAHVLFPVNESFGMPAAATSRMAIAKVGRLPTARIAQYPAGTDIRPLYGNELPPGIAMLSFAVRNLDRLEDDFITPPMTCSGPLYGGRRTATVMGPAEELIELIEVG